MFDGGVGWRVQGVHVSGRALGLPCPRGGVRGAGVPGVQWCSRYWWPVVARCVLCTLDWCVQGEKQRGDSNVLVKGVPRRDTNGTGWRCAVVVVC